MNSGWLRIGDAPVSTIGHVWSPDPGFRNRTDVLGMVLCYPTQTGEARMVSTHVSGNAFGFEFTRWHPLPEPPDA